MQRIGTRCGACGAVLTVAKDDEGTVHACERCQRPVRVPDVYRLIQIVRQTSKCPGCATAMTPPDQDGVRLCARCGKTLELPYWSFRPAGAETQELHTQ